MVVTHARENKQMEEECVTLETKLQDLDEKFIGLHIQHSTMRNQRQHDSSVDTGFSSSNNFRRPKMDFPLFNGDDLTGWIYRAKQYFNLHNTF